MHGIPFRDLSVWCHVVNTQLRSILEARSLLYNLHTVISAPFCRILPSMCQKDRHQHHFFSPVDIYATFSPPRLHATILLPDSVCFHKGGSLKCKFLLLRRSHGSPGNAQRSVGTGAFTPNGKQRWESWQRRPVDSQRPHVAVKVTATSAPV